jgi:hypothetical protein
LPSPTSRSSPPSGSSKRCAGSAQRGPNSAAAFRRNRRFEGTLFGFDQAKYELLRKRIAAERDILRALEQALARGDRAETRALAGRLKSGFAQIYVMFGDFGSG